MSKVRSAAYKARRRKGGSLYEKMREKQRRQYARRKARMNPEQVAELSAQRRAYYLANHENFLSYQAAYRNEHREERAAYRNEHREERRAYYIANRNHILGKARARYISRYIPRPPRQRLSVEQKRAKRRERYYADVEKRRRQFRESYYRHHERNLAEKARRRAEQTKEQRMAAVIRARARRAEAIIKIKEGAKKQRWILSRLIGLAREDGIYDQLKEQYAMADDLYDRLFADLIRGKERGENYKSVKDELWERVLTDKDRYLSMFFSNWFNNNWARDTTIKPYQERKKMTPEQIKERRKSDANLRGIALMNTFLSDGETRLKDATGAQVRLEQGWLGLIAKHVKPNEIVGRKLTVQQLYNLRIQAEPKEQVKVA